ncbi:MAG: hypothetical protein K5925_02210 [Bacilli bacterium]|nr:hypothetical protein [Bacilli bacterium]
MKRRNVLTLICTALLSISLFSCYNFTTSSSESSWIDSGGWEPSGDTYTITFISEDNIVKTYENISYGQYVEIPEVEHSSERYSLKGWSGIDDEDFKSGKVMVYESDATYIAKWSEKFGTETIYEAMQRKYDMDIEIDGVKDEAYNQATAIPVSIVTSNETETTANAYAMWDETYLYLLVEVNDATYNPYTSGEINDFDSVNIFMDILHNDSLAIENYSTGWGGNYRGEPGPMCEGWFRIGAGVSFPQGDSNYGDGSDFGWDGWLSFAARESGTTVGTTYKTDNGYNVEYRIDCTNENVPTELHLHEGQEIGIGINVYDKGDESSSVVCLEDINQDMAITPKRLSNFKLIPNPLQDKIIYPAIHVRESYKVTDKDKYDAQFKDATEFIIGDSTARILWDEYGIYFYFTFGDNTSSIELKSDLTSETKTLTQSGKIFIEKTGLDSTMLPEFDFIVNGDEENIIEAALRLRENNNNVSPSRLLFEADYLDEGESITIDGKKDEAYESAPEIDVSNQSLKELDSLAATGKAYIKWDNQYIYIFVDVEDDDVDSTTVNNSSPEKNDSVEIWISTCQTMPTLSTRWGWPTGGVNSLRPRENYCGEGKFARRAGNPDNPLVGFHWMWDNIGLVERKTASVLTDTGYTVEFKIGWGTFATDVNDKLNEIIDLGININDGENNSRKGIVCLNSYGHEIYNKPGYLDHVILVNK